MENIVKIYNTVPAVTEAATIAVTNLSFFVVIRNIEKCNNCCRLFDCAGATI